MAVTVDFKLVGDGAKHLDDDIKKLSKEGLEMVAVEAEREAKRYWPVDSGRSRRGLSTIVRGRRIHFTNRYNYAYWVERKRFPLLPFFRGGRMRRILQKVERRLNRG